MELFVVYSFDLDDDCLKKSEIKIHAVYDNLKEAENNCCWVGLCLFPNGEGYCKGDVRCHGVNIEKVILNKLMTSDELDNSSSSDS